MQEWLKAALVSGPQPAWDAVLARLLAAALLGSAAAAVYAWTHRRDETFSVNFLATLVLLAILIATVSQVIGNELARAFGLVGALAIVRFRTIVEDTRDTAFVMVAVILGMAIGYGYPFLAVAALSFSAIAALIFQPRRSSPESGRPRWILSIRVGVGHDHERLLPPVFDKHLASSRLLGAATARQGAAIELSWTVVLRMGSTPANFVAEVNRLEGVQNVELRPG